MGRPRIYTREQLADNVEKNRRNIYFKSLLKGTEAQLRKNIQRVEIIRENISEYTQKEIKKYATERIRLLRNECSDMLELLEFPPDKYKTERERLQEKKALEEQKQQQDQKQQPQEVSCDTDEEEEAKEREKKREREERQKIKRKKRMEAEKAKIRYSQELAEQEGGGGCTEK